ncbi:MAG: TIGR02281 family clan AA aspartic protease [Candidatus Gastranaerophilales bacterium]|nr:TIGR02281 family clan AA aspartic protease [Candidatus Gastranaerophilales bacterium]
MFKRLIISLFLVLLLFASSKASADNIRTGLGYYKLGEYSKAEATFRNLLQKEPHNNQAKYMLAISLVQQKKFNEAKQYYKDIIVSSNNESLVSLSQKGLSNLGENSALSGNSNVNRAVINVNTAGSVMVVNNVTLNNKLKTSFILDTGASYTTISTATANALGISTQNAQTVRVMTGSGYADAKLVKISKIEVQGISATNVEALVLDLPAHKGDKSDDMAGLLGMSFLDRFKTTINKQRGQVTLERL